MIFDSVLAFFVDTTLSLLKLQQFPWSSMYKFGQKNVSNFDPTSRKSINWLTLVITKSCAEWMIGKAPYWKPSCFRVIKWWVTKPISFLKGRRNRIGPGGKEPFLNEGSKTGQNCWWIVQWNLDLRKPDLRKKDCWYNRFFST